MAKNKRGMFMARLLAHRGTEKSFCKIMPIPPAPPMTILKGDKKPFMPMERSKEPSVI